ncbi:MAG TPA: efflux RND transporter permease subunit [Pirellulales bacterium]|nr:efflux RND transporter permease subunit [Pirellulales bacterium]
MSQKQIVWLLVGLGGVFCFIIVAAVLVATAPIVEKLLLPAPRLELVVTCPEKDAFDVERTVVIPLEIAFAGMPHLKNLRSLATSGRGYVALEFDRTADSTEAQRNAIERLQLADDLPPGVVPAFSPLSNARELLRFTIIDPRGAGDHSQEMIELGSLVRQRLLELPAVVEVGLAGPTLPRTTDATPSDAASQKGFAGESWLIGERWHDADDVVEGTVWVDDFEAATDHPVVRQILEQLVNDGETLPSQIRLHYDCDQVDGAASGQTFWLQGELPADLPADEVPVRLRELRTTLQTFGELERIVTQVGPIGGERPERPGGIDVRMICGPDGHWPAAPEYGRRRTFAELQAAVRRRVDRQLPGANWRTTSAPPGEWWRWWSNRSGQTVVKVYGDNLDKLGQAAEDVRQQLANLPDVNATWLVPPASSHRESRQASDVSRLICREQGRRLIAVGLATDESLSSVTKLAKSATADLRLRLEWEDDD